MSANQTPIHPKSIRHGVVAIAPANANRDGTGTVGTLITAGTDGTLISVIMIKATVTTNAGLIRIFVHDGSAFFLVGEVAVDAITASATVAAFEPTWTPPGTEGLMLPSGYSIRVSTEKAETFHVHCEGGDF